MAALFPDWLKALPTHMTFLTLNPLSPKVAHPKVDALYWISTSLKLILENILHAPFQGIRYIIELIKFN